jgi:serine O-acetyltransferase
MTKPEDDSLDLATVVAGLRAVRMRALEQRDRTGRPPRLPVRAVLTEIVDGLSMALYPNRLGGEHMSPEGIDYFVGHRLEASLRLLVGQVLRELRYEPPAGLDDAALGERAASLVRAFAARLPAVRELLDTDLQAAFEGDPAARSIDEVLVCYPGVLAMRHHRIAHELYALGLPILARMVAEIAHTATGIDIHPGASIGPRFFIDHGTGVVIGETCVIGAGVRLYQAVTLGAKRFPTDENGVILKGGARHPIVEDDVVVYAGATILGRITIGRGSSIGGCVWLTRSVPPGTSITQSQNRQDGIAPPG